MERIEFAEADRTDCEQFKEADFEDGDINQPDPVGVMSVAASQIANWESGRNIPSIENFIFLFHV